MVALSAQCLVSGDGFQTVDSVDTFLLGVLAAGGGEVWLLDSGPYFQA